MGNAIQRVLMVDDDTSLCESMNDYLASRSNEYLFLGGVSSFKSAIQSFKDGRPNIVILDMMLGPGQDGSDLVEEFRQIEKELNFTAEIFIYSKSGIYENYCVRNNLLFMQKGENNPELLIKRIERFVNLTPASNQVIKMDITPPKIRKDRMTDNLWAMFTSIGAHSYKGYDDCKFLILKIVDSIESGNSITLEQILNERGAQIESTHDAIQARISNMLKTLWSKAPIELLKQFYPPDTGNHTYPTPLAFLDYHARRLIHEYPKNVENV